MKSEHITAKAILITIEFLLGIASPAWWIVTYFMITGTLHGEITASICVPIGIGMLTISIATTFLLIFLHKKIFRKRVYVFLSSFVPFLSGAILFFICALLGVK